MTAAADEDALYWADAEDFLASRARFAEVATVAGPDGGYAVVLVIDGYYTDRREAEEIGAWFAAGLRPFDRRREVRVGPPRYTRRHYTRSPTRNGTIVTTATDSTAVLIAAGVMLTQNPQASYVPVAHPTPPAQALEGVVENVSGATGKRYQTRDNTGASMDGLKIIGNPRGGYLGVYHTTESHRVHVSRWRPRPTC